MATSSRRTPRPPLKRGQSAKQKPPARKSKRPPAEVSNTAPVDDRQRFDPHIPPEDVGQHLPGHPLVALRSIVAHLADLYAQLSETPFPCRVESESLRGQYFRELTLLELALVGAKQFGLDGFGLPAHHPLPRFEGSSNHAA